MLGMRASALAWIAWLLAASPARACTVCHSTTADELRGLLVSSIQWGLLGALAPIALTLALCWVVRELTPWLLGRVSNGERP